MSEEERRSDPAGRDRLDEIERGYLERADENRDAIAVIARTYDRFVRIATAILVAIAIITGGVGALSVYLLGENASRGREVRALVTQIQQERRESVIRSCVAQNGRHDKTLARLETLIGQLPDPRERARARRNQGGTVALIEALAPRQNCAALAAKTVGSR